MIKYAEDLNHSMVNWSEASIAEWKAGFSEEERDLTARAMMTTTSKAAPPQQNPGRQGKERAKEKEEGEKMRMEKCQMWILQYEVRREKKKKAQEKRKIAVV